MEPVVGQRWVYGVQVSSWQHLTSGFKQKMGTKLKERTVFCGVSAQKWAHSASTDQIAYKYGTVALAHLSHMQQGQPMLTTLLFPLCNTIPPSSHWFQLEPIVSHICNTIKPQPSHGHGSNVLRDLNVAKNSAEVWGAA